MAAASSLSSFAGVILAAAILTGTIAFANVRGAPQPSKEVADESAVAETPATRGAGKAHKHARCRECGVIQAIRRIDAAEGQPPTYEITIRLHDGSTRTNTNATPGTWRAGDRILLINRRDLAASPTT
jgi:hypothetical protein